MLRLAVLGCILQAALVVLHLWKREGGRSTGCQRILADTDTTSTRLST